jgi:thiol-disulfide isomerase/thioredoxin
MKVLKFSAVWCSSCLVMNPIWNDIKKEHNWLEVVELDYDIDKEQVEEFSVTNILPTVIFVDDNGNELIRYFGEKSKNILLNTINEYKDK